MTISGFTMAKNAAKLYYPWKQAILSILPIVDEFVVALGDCDPDDTSRLEIESIGSDKIKIIDTVWDIEEYPRGMENAHQTDIAKSHCSGDWLFYLQADEVIHEKYLPEIKKRCTKLLDDAEVEGFVLNYKHFWGDYWHYHNSHKWYKQEIRIVRNHPDIHSWESAQSFRRIPGFDGLNYRVQKGAFNLKVAAIDAEVFHYGWVRPPKLMRDKNKALDIIHKGKDWVDNQQKHKVANYDYGPLNRIAKFEGTHPAVMKEWIEKFDWAGELQYSGKPSKARPPHKHEMLKYRVLSWIENKLNGGNAIGAFTNFILLPGK
ncbi:MAG: hypothetical protein K9H64_07225 [Bacteroidales bacterium]|nr:hypothetical protein [Bacteroidales bacterium]MCF8455548.1 hypothetical protein [Bacteroidales bacterium]